MIDDLITRLETEEGSEALDMAIARHRGFRIVAVTGGAWHIMRQDGGAASWDLPHYSRSLEAALTLMEEGEDYDILYMHSCTPPYTATVGPSQRPIEVEAPTAALAVCLAWAYALKARKAVGHD